MPEMRVSHLFAHELRWARTIQSLAPVGFGLSSLQYPLFWAGLALVLSGFEPWALLLFGATWLTRAAAMLAIDVGRSDCRAQFRFGCYPSVIYCLSQ